MTEYTRSTFPVSFNTEFISPRKCQEIQNPEFSKKIKFCGRKGEEVKSQVQLGVC